MRIRAARSNTISYIRIRQSEAQVVEAALNISRKLRFETMKETGSIEGFTVYARWFRGRPGVTFQPTNTDRKPKSIHGAEFDALERAIRELKMTAAKAAL